MLDKISLNQGTIRHLPLELGLKVAADAGFPGFGIWSERVFSYIKNSQHEDKAYELIKNSKMEIAELIYLKEWLFVEGKAKNESLNSIEEICKMAGKINAECICAPAYGYEGNIKTGIQNFKDFCDIASYYNVKVAIEFVPCFKINNLLSTWEIVDAASKNNGGILADAFHIFKGTTKLKDFEQVPIEKLFLVHICDGVEVNSRIDFIQQARGHRVFPGEGNFDLKAFIALLKSRNYQGFLSLEVLNKYFEYMDPSMIAYHGKNSVHQILEDAAT